MSAGITALERIQLGLESTPGTAVAATARLIGKLDVTDEQKLWRPNDYATGRLAEFEKSYPTGIDTHMDFESDGNFQQINYLLGMALIGGIAPTNPGSGQYLWTWLPLYTASNTPNTYTIEYGQDVQAWKAAFCLCEEIEISGSVDGVWTVKAKLFGRTLATATFTGSLSNPTTLEPGIFNTSTLYVDNSWANMGNTAVPATVVDFTWKFKTGFKPMKYANTVLYFSDIAQAKRSVELDMTLALTSGVAGYFADYRAQTYKYVRLECIGSALASGFNKIQLDQAGPLIRYGDPLFGHREGQDTVKVKLSSQWDTTGAKDMRVLVTNALASMP